MDMTPVESSNVHSVGYDSESQVTRVRFHNGSEYEYTGVPEDAHQELVGAKSVGGHLAQKFKGNYPAQRVA